MLGPVDYVVVGFKGNQFDGSILNELSTAVKNHIIRVIDLLFIMKDKDGNITDAEFIDQSDDLKATFGDLSIDGDTPLVSETDIQKLGAKMDNDTSAGVLVVEHVWAKGLKQALKDAGGFLVDDGRIHADTIEAASKELATA